MCIRDSLQEAYHLCRYVNRVRVVPVDHNHVVGVDLLKGGTHGGALAFPLIKNDMCAFSRGDFPCGISGVPVDHVRRGFKTILEQIRNGDPFDDVSYPSVSYTHLRAHETDSYLVCRLLLEKKKKKKN